MEIPKGKLRVMKQQLLDSEAVIRSLRCALENHMNPRVSLQRIRGMLAHLPSETLHIRHYKGSINYYEYVDSKMKYLTKGSDRLYLLARKRYLTELLRTLEVAATKESDPEKWEKQFEKLAKLIRQYAKGNLDVARIVLTNKQYKWLTRQFHQKPKPARGNSTPLTTDSGETVLSKSEQNIGNALWHYAVPNHYEEQLQINIMSLVSELESELADAMPQNGNLFYFRAGTCYWNVPEQLQFMNAPGSVWHTFNFRTGCITIHPDFTIMLVDGSLLYFEHEGLLIQFRYRANATERIAIMRICGGVDTDHLIQTTEDESNDRQRLEAIIQRQIIPRIWF